MQKPDAHSPSAGAVRSDPSHDFLRAGRPALEPFFQPRAVAVIGATEKEGSVGRAVFRNLLDNPSGIKVYPVNPARPAVLGHRAYPDVKALPERVDLALLITRAATVPGLIGECVEAGIPAAIVLSAGFRETGAAGLELEKAALEKARRGRLRIIGPNCLGLMNPFLGLNATFAGTVARPGNLAFLSQSGALCTAILDWSLEVKVGFSGFVSTGSMIDVGWGDLLDHFGADSRTKAILLYMETIGDARAFLSAAREVAFAKPVIVIKAGRTEQAAKAVSSHTGTLAGSDAVLDAAFRRAGVQRVDSIAELFYLAEALGQQPRPRGSSLAVVTNAGGPGVLCVDALIAGGGELAALTPETHRALDGALPPHWSHNNPIDVIGDADAERFARAVEIALRDESADGVLAILTLQAMTDPTETARRVAGLARAREKPLLASWMGGAGVKESLRVLSRAGIPAFPFPDTAARIFNYMAAHERALRNLYETPRLPAEERDMRSAAEEAAAVIREPWEKGRALLTEWESKRLLSAYGIPVAETKIAATEEQALQAARSLGYPVVAKLHSETLTHKTDVDGVRLDLREAAQVAEAFRGIRDSVAAKAGKEHFQGVSIQPMVREKGFELILGGSVNPQFGPVVLFGWGGTLVEVLRDQALALPPLNTNLARLLMERTKVFQALRGVRGRPPVDLAALEETLVRFSQIMLDHPRIKEIDVNPLLVSHRLQVALDARVVLHPRDARPEDMPRPAIRPYPSKYVGEFVLKDGRRVLIRPVRPEDEPLFARFHARLSERTVFNRYFAAMRLNQRTAHERLMRLCFIDYDRSLALAVVNRDGTGEEVVAVGRLTRMRDRPAAEMAVLVEDGFQGLGLGRELVLRLLRAAAEEGLQGLVAHVLRTNLPMQALLEKVGFRLEPPDAGGVVTAEYRVVPDIGSDASIFPENQ